MTQLTSISFDQFNSYCHSGNITIISNNCGNQYMLRLRQLSKSDSYRKAINALNQIREYEENKSSEPLNPNLSEDDTKEKKITLAFNAYKASMPMISLTIIDPFVCLFYQYHESNPSKFVDVFKKLDSLSPEQAYYLKIQTHTLNIEYDTPTPNSYLTCFLPISFRFGNAENFQVEPLNCNTLDELFDHIMSLPSMSMDTALVQNPKALTM